MNNEFFNDEYFTKDTYWYFRFISTFFEQKHIKDMENIPMFGYQFIIIYLKLCCLAVECKGYIRIPVYGAEGNYLIYLAKDLKVDVQVASESMSYYVQNKLVEVYKKENEVIVYVPFIENNTGRSSHRADKARIAYRRKKMLDNDDSNIDLVETSSMEAIEDNVIRYGEFENVLLTYEQYQELISLYDIKNVAIVISELSIDKKLMGIEVVNDFEYLKEKLN